MERCNDKELKHKLTPTVDGPYSVMIVDTKLKNLFIEGSNQAVENFTRNCVVLAPNTKTKADLMVDDQIRKLTEVFPTSQ